MAIHYICSHCGKRLTIADEYEGRVASCLSCGGVDIVTPAPPSSIAGPVIAGAAALVVIVVLVVASVVYHQTHQAPRVAVERRGPQFFIQPDSVYYHSQGCTDLTDPTPYPKDQILARGYKPCPKCQFMAMPAKKREPSAESAVLPAPGGETGASVTYLGKHVGSAIIDGKGISVYDGDGFRFGVYMAELPPDARAIPFSRISGVKGEFGGEISVPAFGELRMVESPELIVK